MHINHDLVGLDVNDGEPLRDEPVGDGGEVRGGGAKQRAHLLRRQPLVIQRIARGLLVGKELREGRLHGWIALQHDRETHVRALRSTALEVATPLLTQVGICPVSCVCGPRSASAATRLLCGTGRSEAIR